MRFDVNDQRTLREAAEQMTFDGDRLVIIAEDGTIYRFRAMSDEQGTFLRKE